MEFYESQRFRQWWLWLIVIISVSLPLIIVSVEYILDKPLSGEPSSLRNVIIMTAFSSVGLLLVGSIRLDTKINARGVHYRFFPIHFRYQTILWEEIDEAYVREYSPIKEYGGWGIRWGLFNKTGMAYNISGNKGLQLILKNEKKILIGTQKAHKLQSVLSKMRSTV